MCEILDISENLFAAANDPAGLIRCLWAHRAIAEGMPDWMAFWFAKNLED